jgi:signal recognition particle subunit SRP54
MTPAERVRPEIIDGSRRRRIADGSGMSPSDVNTLVDQFRQVKSMMKQLGPISGLVGRKGKGKKKKGGRVTPKKGAALAPGLPGLPDLPGLPRS